MEENKMPNGEVRLEDIGAAPQQPAQQQGPAVPPGYYMGANGILYPIGTPQYGIATHVAPRASASDSAVAKKNNSTGAFITALITTGLSIAFTVLTYWWVIDMLAEMEGAGEAAGFLTLLIFVFLGPGWVSFLPAVALSGVGLGCGIKAVHSESKAMKAFSIIAIIVSSLVLLALFLVLTLLMAGPWMG